METKTCSTCKQEKYVAEFYENKHTKSGYQSSCKMCQKNKRPRAYKKPHDPESDKAKASAARDAANLGLSNKKSILRISEDLPEGTHRCKMCLRVLNKSEFHKNRHVKCGVQPYCKSCQSFRTNEYFKNRTRSDEDFKLRRNIRQMVCRSVASIKFCDSFEALGTSLEEFKSYIEGKFKVGMTWDNWGQHGWHLDHVKPLSSFNLTDEVQFKEASNFKNLQPLWWYENLQKNATEEWSEFVVDTSSMSSTLRDVFKMASVQE